MNKDYKYDVAISFVEEDRDAALALSQAFEKEGLKAYYYPDDRNVPYGTDLEEQLIHIYSQEAKYAVILFSPNYFNPDKVYTKIELAAIQKRMEDDSDIVYMLPVRLKENVAFTDHPNLEKLIYFKWNYSPGIIAKELKKLLGKELLSTDESSGTGNIIYNSGDRSVFIKGSNTEEVNQTIIFSAGENPIIISKKEAEGINIQQFQFANTKETKYPCPYCSEELEVKNYGINQCHNCGKKFFIENPAINVSTYKTLDPVESKELNKIRAHIRNKIRDWDYNAAYKYCLKAEELAPGESSTWEHFALTEFLREIWWQPQRRLEIPEIIKIVKTHTEKSKDCGIPDEDYDGLVLDIANRLFTIEKSRINSLRAAYRDDLGYDNWSPKNFDVLKKRLRSFEICYSLYKDTLYLEEYVNELTKPNKWVEKNPETDQIENTPACGKFNAYEKLKNLVRRIKEVKPDYEHPPIATHRFVVLSVENAKTTDITPSGPDNTNNTSFINSASSDENDIQILSIE